jgi:glutaredoxin 3
MAEVILYSTRFCPYCVRAKNLLERKGVPFSEVRIDTDTTQRDIMIEKSGRRTVPQIFIGDFHVGGCDDLYALDARGELDSKLGLK